MRPTAGAPPPFPPRPPHTHSAVPFRAVPHATLACPPAPRVWRGGGAHAGAAAAAYHVDVLRHPPTARPASAAEHGGDWCGASVAAAPCGGGAVRAVPRRTGRRPSQRVPAPAPASGGCVWCVEWRRVQLGVWEASGRQDSRRRCRCGVAQWRGARRRDTPLKGGGRDTPLKGGERPPRALASHWRPSRWEAGPRQTTSTLLVTVPTPYRHKPSVGAGGLTTAGSLRWEQQ